MKFLALIGACFALTLASCGGSGQTGGSITTGEEVGGAQDAVAKTAPCPRGPTVNMSKAEIAKLPPLRIPRPAGPPPHRLTVIDLRKGSGPGIPRDNLVSNREKPYLNYFDASYQDALKGHLTGQYGPGKYLPEEMPKGEALGLVGMKVGGRREIITPPKLVYPRWQPSWGYAPYVDIYVVDLLGMEPPPDRRVEYRHGRPC
ncbi:MAG TPA: hypothetical protein VFJ64_12955 [Solirubrobacterales bacterium]|nr:hypothetical protein [Solirubrobacterales bacterium]